MNLCFRCQPEFSTRCQPEFSTRGLEIPGPLEMIKFYPIVQKTTQSKTKTIVAYLGSQMSDLVGTELGVNPGLSVPPHCNLYDVVSLLRAPVKSERWDKTRGLC